MIQSKYNCIATLNKKFVGKFSESTFICLFLIVTTLFVFWPVTRCDFLNYDDPDYFTSNPHVLTGLTLDNVTWALTSGFTGNWHPLTWLSLMLDVEIFGKNSFGPHFTNLLFHAANASLLFLLLRQLTSAIWRSVLVASLFALHPLHVESVAWVAERKDVLSTFFALLALLSYAHYAKYHCRRSFQFALVFFVFSLMAKSMLVTLPFVMLLLDWWPLQRISNPLFKTENLQRLFVEKIPFLMLSAIFSTLTFFVQKKVGAMATLGAISIPDRIENAFVSYARYLGKTIWPAALANPYPHPGHWDLSLAVYSTVLIVWLSAIAVLYSKRFPFLLTGWFWFVGTLIPVIGLVQVGDAAMADRYTYFPLIGIFIIFVWITGFIIESWHVSNLRILFFAAIILAAFAFRTRDQLLYWQNSGTLFSHTLNVTDNNYAAENDLGTWLSAQGKVRGSMDCFRRSLLIKADNPDALYNLGNSFAKLGNWDEAIVDYKRALKVTPDQADILSNLGLALAAKKQFDEAAICFESALKLNPDSADAHNNLATLYFMEQKFDKAAQHYREAIRISPANPQIYANLGDTLIRQNNISEAVQNYQTALSLNPDDAKTKAKLQALGLLP